MEQQAREAINRCLCGHVRIRVTGEPLWTAFCHCESCRRATGGALVLYCGYPHERAKFEGGLPQYYESSPGVRRGFCAICGTTMTFEGARWPDEIHLSASNFEEPGSFAPKCHVYAGEQMPWLYLADGLPRYRTVPNAGDRMP
jgi:hypothetical protein